MSNDRQCGQCLAGSRLGLLKGIKLWMKLDLSNIRGPQHLVLHCPKFILPILKGPPVHIRVCDFL